MGVNDIQVVFSDSLSTYYSGSKVAAIVIINIDQPKKVREINVKFLGAGSVQWTEYENEKNSEGMVLYSGQETLFESHSRLCAETTLPIGRHTYDVAGFLPPNAPGSFEGEHGHIRYTLTVTIVRAWSLDEALTVPFTVVYPVEINRCAAARERLIVEKNKTVGCFCWKSGPLSATMHAPLTGYCPEQSIPVTVAIENFSTSNVTEAVCSLDKVTTYNARQPVSKSKIVCTEIAAVQLGRVGANGDNTWTRNIVLPNNLQATNSVTSSLIKISYELKLNTKVSKVCRRGISLSAPVIICTTDSNTQQHVSEFIPHLPAEPSYYAPNAVQGCPPQNFADSFPNGPTAPPPPYSAVAGMPDAISWTNDYSSADKAYNPGRV